MPKFTNYLAADFIKQIAMHNELLIVDRILYTDLRPVQTETKSEAWFKSMLATMEIIQPIFPYAYQVNFITALTTRSRYYKLLIDNACHHYYNEINTETTNADCKEARIYLTEKALQKIILVKLSDTCHEIAANHVDTQACTSGPGDNANSKNAWETAYIYQYLKLRLLCLYLNVQQAQKNFLISPALTVDDLFLKFTGGYQQEKACIALAPATAQPMAPLLKAGQSTAADTEKPVHRPPKDASGFDPVVKRQTFEQVEQFLKEYGILDTNGLFIANRKESHHRRLAVVYKLMIKNGFFRKTDPYLKKPITDHSIRKFLDQRYQVDLKETLKKLTEAHIEETRLKLPWLDRIMPAK